MATNKECEAKLVDLVEKGCTDALSTIIAQEITIDMFAKCSASMLGAFIKVRQLKNLLDSYMLPNKGKPSQVRAGVTDAKTKGPLMIALAYQIRLQQITGVVPNLPPIKQAPLFILPPTVIS